jgi:predicted HicB family RNase H-like nuclease
MNLMNVDGYHAKIDYDEEMDQFRGEILGLSGGADFYGSSPEELRREFKKSLDVFLEVCKEQGIEPRRHYSDKFNLRIPPELHEKLAMTAEAQGKSLNSLAQEALQRSVSA